MIIQIFIQELTFQHVIPLLSTCVLIELNGDMKLQIKNLIYYKN